MLRFEKIFKTDPTKLEEEIHRVLSQMAEIDDPADEKYAKLNDQLKQLHALKEAETSHKRVSRDQLVAAAVHLAGIVAVINHERLNTITSRTASMIMKPFR